LIVLAEKLRKQAQAKSVMLKMAEEGLLIHSWGGADIGILSDQVPALNAHPKDVAGAGDSLLITAAMAITCGASIWEAGYFGSLSAAIQVGRIGNTPLKLDELISEI
jgi:sugar/nucleoside kinase (ribokinase family)